MVDQADLESLCGRKVTMGSNPIPSACTMSICSCFQIKTFIKVLQKILKEDYLNTCKVKSAQQGVLAHLS